jgi:peptide/nickel transport system ATP-binding protein
VQAQILNLLMRLQRAHDLTYLFISHDVSVIRHLADRIAVMYLGQVVELGRASEVLDAPFHPYTRSLLSAVPRVSHGTALDTTMSGTELPSNTDLPEGCFFRDRCPFAAEGCERPQALAARNAAHTVRCHRKDDLPPGRGWR